MSDSDEDSIHNNHFSTYRSDNMEMCTRGPNVNNTNVTVLNYQNNGLTATMDMPVNFEREQYGGSMSLRSGPVYRPPLLNRSIYHKEIGSQRFMYNGRGGSSASVHSIDTAASVISAADIVFAFNNGSLNKCDLRTIKDACSKLMKNQRRQRVEKRRKLKLFLKGFRHKNGDDSGEQGSDSSISDDCRSIRTTICKENIPNRKQMRNLSYSRTNIQIDRNCMTNVSHFNSNMIENPIFTDRTKSIKRNTMRSMISNNSADFNYGAKNRFINKMRTYDRNQPLPQNTSLMTSKGHFNNCLPSLWQSQKIQNTFVGEEQDMSALNSSYNISTNEMEKNEIETSNQAGPGINRDKDQNPLTQNIKNQSAITQKERFKKGFLLPSQRFNKTVASLEHNLTKSHKDCDKSTKKTMKNKDDLLNQVVSEGDSTTEDVFKIPSCKQKESQNIKRKRKNNADNTGSLEKKNKLNSPKSLQSSNPTESICNIPKQKSNDFVFAKPKIPIEKGNSTKAITPEKLLAKSRVPRIDEEINFNFSQNNKSNENNENEFGKDISDNTQSDIIQSNSDISMRPSFIKRKLFTQKLDVAEKKNESCDNIGVNSPQNIYSASMRERNKARKLVTTQSCLSREICGEDNNVLDLIHKIVPPDQINITNATKKTEVRNNSKSNDDANTEKWDVTAVIANCDNENISETYTDEEIFNVNQGKKSDKCKSLTSSKEMKNCKIVINKLKQETVNKAMKNSGNTEFIKPGDKAKTREYVSRWVKSFWDTDSDSDNNQRSNVGDPLRAMTQNQQSLHKSSVDLEDKPDQYIRKTLRSKGTILSVRNSYKQSNLNDRVKTDKSQSGSERLGSGINKTNAVVEVHNNTKKEKSNNETTAKSQTGKKKSILKENDQGNNKHEALRGKRRSKQYNDCNFRNKAMNTPNKSNENRDEGIKEKLKEQSTSKKLSVKTTIRPKDNKYLELKQINEETKKEGTKPEQKINMKTQHAPLRTQPTRKSKENSFIYSSKFRAVSSKTKLSNNVPNTKISQETSYNSSINNISVMTTRSRSKLSLHSSGYDLTA